MVRLINQVHGMDAVKSITEKCEWILPEEARPKPGQVRCTNVRKISAELNILHRCFQLSLADIVLRVHSVIEW